MLRRLRSEQRKPLADLARLAHYSKGYLSKIENGAQSATLPLARRLEDALGAPPGALTALVPAVSPHHGNPVAHGLFPEAQLWTDLRGFSPGSEPVDPAAVLEEFLRLLGVPGERMPAGLQARSPCTGTVWQTGAPWSYWTTPPTRTRSAPCCPAAPAAWRSSPAVARRAELCGHLPIAVAPAARRLQTRPAWSVAEPAARLESAPRRLAQLTAGNSAVEAVLELSYRSLPAAQQRFFRLPALHPGPDLTAHSAAGCYRFHDLVRLYAGGRARAEDGEEQCDAAVQRLLEWYRVAVEAARSRIGSWQLMRTPDRHTAPPEPGDGHAAPVPALPSPAVPPAALPHLPDGPAALGWMEEERPNLLAAVEKTARRERHELTQHLATGLQPLLALRQYRTDSFRVLDRLRTASRHSGSPAGESEALCHLGSIYLGIADCRAAQECYGQALDACPRAGEPLIRAAALNGLAVTQWAFGRYRHSEEHLLRALACAGTATPGSSRRRYGTPWGWCTGSWAGS
ncbi:helix-turn-helix domain-containing protein [Streptomyces sp. VNUA116]|uniref:helix-turn-helix domain-containing protein n=1 Tax=Streptomyces sp. VNUA116 TaxID=3062449 RepID=UPI002675E537|nr:helix-turn-helix domain-containing protein [Streptomyces sp. VNUA116]WKU43207.1 helix-turn-helix domain-containing protein [Streptomyces sp. VNUA116]